MKKFFYSLIAFFMLTWTLCGAPSELMQLPLEKAVKIGDFDIPESNSEKSFIFPAMPPRSGFIPVLRCRMGTYKKEFSGCCFAAIINVSGTNLGAQTASGDPRMLGKHPVFEMKSTFPGRQFDYWAANDAKIDMPYGPSCDAIDADSIGGNATVYLLDLRDVISDVDRNTLTFKNIRRNRAPFPLTLMVRDCEIGYISEKIIPAKPSTQIKYEKLELKRTRGDLSLEVGKSGGFVLNHGKNNQLIVESRLGMDFNSPNTILASDKRVPKEKIAVKNFDFGPYGVKTEIEFPNQITMTRTLKIRPDGLVQWVEKYRNNSKNIIGIPFHHRLSFNSKDPRIWLSGEPEATYIPTPASHPTVVLEERTGEKRGFGITMENDITRLISAIKNIGDTGEIYTTTLALAPGMTQVVEFSIDPLEKGGYWEFINRLRNRWKLNTATVEAPLFLAVTPHKLPKKNTEEFLKKTYGHLGPVVLGLKPWRSGEHDIVKFEKYPKLSKDAPRTIGGTPDVDIEEFLTFKHRKIIDDYQKKYIDMIHKVLPEAKVILQTHASMEAVYWPLAEQWEYADCAIRDPNGEIYHLPHYDLSHFGPKYAGVGKGDWVIAYYVPYGGSKYYEKLLNDIQQGIDIGFDGVYIDEFSFVFERAGYSRYTYDRWDGFSADLGKKGEVLRLKSDNAYATASFQHAAIDLMKRQGKYFLGNGMAGLRSVNTAPSLRFWEASMRIGWAHIDKVPTLLGHHRGNLKKTFEGARLAMKFACIYSPFHDIAVCLPPDNFISKQYPLTVVRIMPGGIIGKERLITINSGEYEWPGVEEGTTVNLFIYNVEGHRIKKGATARIINGKIRLDVPRDGMIIAELPQKK